MLISELGALDDTAVLGGIVWKPVPEYEDNYAVSDYGAVYSLKSKRILHMSLCHGYYTISLSKNGQTKTARVHRLVALSFIPNPDNKKYIDHINTIRTDNRVENLRWCTMLENNINPLTLAKKSATLKRTCASEEGRAKLVQARAASAKARARKIQCIETGIIYDSLKEAALQTGLTPSKIWLACKYNKGSAYTLSHYRGKPVIHFRYYN